MARAVLVKHRTLRRKTARVAAPIQFQAQAHEQQVQELQAQEQHVHGRRTNSRRAKVNTCCGLGAALGGPDTSSVVLVLDDCIRPTLASSEAAASVPTNARKGRPCARSADGRERGSSAR